MIKKWLSLCLLLNVIGAFPLAEIQAAESKAATKQAIPWKDYNLGIRLATQQKKMQMIFFYDSYCPYCRKMEKVTFQDNHVKKRLEQWFIPIRVKNMSTAPVVYHGKQIKETDLFPHYGVHTYPAIALIDSDGTRLTLWQGYLGPEALQQMLEFAGTRAYEKMNYEEFIQKTK